MNGCDAPVLGWLTGICLSPLQIDSSCSLKGSAIEEVGANTCDSILAATPLVSRPPGGDSLLPAMKEGSTQTATLLSLPSEPPRAAADCVSYLKQSTRHFGFSLGVARQLAHCRHLSTRMNYQAKWTVYREWCHCHGHSVSRPSIPKAADFLLYLHRSLSLSYSCIASYRSMLSGVFRFVLPELSPHFVLHDLLPPFRLERPLPSRVPPWNLLRVLDFLRGPFASCSLRDLTRKLLFLWLLPPRTVLRNFKQFPIPSLLRVRISFSRIYRNFAPRLSLPRIRCLAHFALATYVILWGIFWMSSSCALFVLFRNICRVLRLSLRALALSLYLLILLPVPFLRTP